MTAPRPANKPPFKWKWAPSDSDNDRIVILERWPIINITSFACEPLAKWTKGRSRIVTLNQSVREDFLLLWDRWEREGLLELLDKPSWGGGWAPRYKRGAAHDQNPKNLSNHASGHAFDICAPVYPLGKEVPPGDPMHQLAAVAKEYGWRWGGNFSSRPDGMHYQHTTSPFP